MAVYVDTLLDWGWVLRGHHVKSCHMMADSLDELHEMAEKIGMKRAWFQDDRRHPHYDLTAARRKEAVRLGAQELTCKELIRKRRSERKRT